MQNCRLLPDPVIVVIVVTVVTDAGRPASLLLAAQIGKRLGPSVRVRHAPAEVVPVGSAVVLEQDTTGAAWTTALQTVELELERRRPAAHRTHDGPLLRGS